MIKTKTTKLLHYNKNVIMFSNNDNDDNDNMESNGKFLYSTKLIQNNEKNNDKMIIRESLSKTRASTTTTTTTCFLFVISLMLLMAQIPFGACDEHEHIVSIFYL